MALKLYIIEAKGLKLKVRTFLGLIPSFRLDAGEKPFDVEESFYLPPELRFSSRIWRIQFEELQEFFRISSRNCLYRKIFWLYTNRAYNNRNSCNRNSKVLKCSAPCL